jgi:transcription elongation factor Elf1
MSPEEAEITYTCPHCCEDTVSSVGTVHAIEGVHVDCEGCGCYMFALHVTPGNDECGATSVVTYRCPACHAEWNETALEMTQRLGGPWCDCREESCQDDMPLGNRGVPYR